MWLARFVILLLFVSRADDANILNLSRQVRLPVLPKNQLPWETNSALFGRMRDDRKIVVNAPVTSLDEGYLMGVYGGGIINGPMAKTLSYSTRFDLLPKVSSTIKEARHYPKEDVLFIHGQILKFHARMWLKLFRIHKSASEEQILFEIFHGQFRGLRGELLYSSQPRRSTLMILRAEYNSLELPLPRLLMKIGLEYFIEGAAKDMRSYMEGEWKDGK